MRAQLDGAVSEAGLQQAVEDLAQMYGWMAYHTHDSRRSNPGFPDLVLCHHGPVGSRGEGAVVFAELKRQGGTLSIGQQAWLWALEAAGAEVHVWRPADWDEIVARLQRRGAIR